MTLLAADRLIETDRLILRRIERADFPFFAGIHADPEVARYLAHGNPRTEEESTVWLDAMLKSYATLNLGQLAVTLRKDGTLIGRSGVSDMQVDLAPGADGLRNSYHFPTRAPEGSAIEAQLELGYTFARSAWGAGYASEAANAVYEYTRRTRPKATIVSLIRPENERSKRVAQRFGVTYVDQVSGWGKTYDRYVWP